MEKEIPIMFCFDNNYVIPAAVAFYSLLEHANSNYFYRMYVLHSDITYENRIKLAETIEKFSSFSSLEFIDMTNKFNKLWNKINIKGHFSKEVMYKVLVASIFPQYEKLVVSDVDVVFLSDISDSYNNFEINDDIYLAGVKAVGKIMHYMDNYKPTFTEEEIVKLSVFCGGYIVFNLKKLRDDHMEQKFIKCFETEGYRINQMEQDVLNLCCYPKTLLLPLKYVACSYMWDLYKIDNDFVGDKNYSEFELHDAMTNTVQLHYATSTKPWKNVDCTKSEEWFKYIVKTPFLNEYLKTLAHKIDLSSTDLKSRDKKDQKKKSKLFSYLYSMLIKIKNIQIKKLKFEKPQFKRLFLNKSKILKNNFMNGAFYRFLRYARHNVLFLGKKEFYKKVCRRLQSKIYFLKRKRILYIFDDMFPNKLSPFRYEEYFSYFNYFDNVQCLTSASPLGHIDKKGSVRNIISDFYLKHPKFHGRFTFLPFTDEEDVNKFVVDKYCYKKHLAIATFVNNLQSESSDNLAFLNEQKIPFIFTLYPGGGFAIDDPKCELKLKNIFKSPMFRKVIVTQKITKEYLLKNEYCDNSKILFIPGVVTPAELLNSNVSNKKHYGIDKKTLDICFVAHKYTPYGVDKGYDTFIEVAKQLCQQYSNIFFHVVGSFDENVIDVKEIKNKITFYGIKETEWFKDFYLDKDLILSPNVPNKMIKGCFDGFPTGACTEAMLLEVALFATDELKQNIFFENKKNLILIKPSVKDILMKITYYYNHPQKLSDIAKNGYVEVNNSYSIEKQIGQRLKLIESQFNNKKKVK